MIKNIPNYFTLLNLVCGCLSIILIMQPDLLVNQFSNGALTNGPARYAVMLIFVAGIIDFLDGFVARMMKVSSEMGKQLDSLCDAVTFGVAPALMMFRLIQLSDTSASNEILAALPALLIACCAVWRLAKFNIDARQSTTFFGVPTPITAMVVASLVLVVFTNEWNLRDVLLNQWVLYAVTLVLSIMMVADVPIMSLKFKDYSFKNNQPKFILVGLSIVLLIFFRWAAVPLIYICYVALSLLLRKKI
jgi:CDP-diacylglycerol---serine O-phosphatidyltransferase